MNPGAQATGPMTCRVFAGTCREGFAAERVPGLAGRECIELQLELIN